MPFYRRRFRRKMRPAYYGTKKYGRKKYGRKRFNRKFVKNQGQAYQTIKSLVMPKNLNVKLRSTYNFNTDTTTQDRWVFLGNSIIPYCSSGQTGSGPISYPGSTMLPVNGDTIDAGALEYGQFYESYFSHGSAISVDVVSLNAGPSNILNAVLIPVNYKINPNDLDNLTFAQAMSYAGARYTKLGPSTGGPNRRLLKAFRKTKTMIGIKDVQDDEDLECAMPKSNITNAASMVPTDGFYWYFKIYPAPSAMEYSVTVKIAGYFTLNDRSFVDNGVVDLP